MFCKTSPQTSFLMCKKYYPMSCQKMTGAICIEIKIYPFIDEEIFRELYPSETGRPNTPIKKAVSILIFVDEESV